MLKEQVVQNDLTIIMSVRDFDRDLLYKSVLNKVAWLLFKNAYWTDIIKTEYEKNQSRPDLHEFAIPVDSVPDEVDAYDCLSYVCDMIEQVWGRSFFDVTVDMTSKGVTFVEFRARMIGLVYATVLSCSGGGISSMIVDDDFPDNLNPTPIDIDNPLAPQLELLD